MHPTAALVCKRAFFCVLALFAPAAVSAQASARVNPFHDPFTQVTRGLPACVAPSPPTYTPAAIRDEEHWRVEQGNSCYLAGKCRYSNSYLYDAGIAKRLSRSLASSNSLRNTSIWILVQGRIVELSGCVAQPSQLTRAERLAQQDRDVEGVVVHLMVGTQGRRPYN